MTEKNFSSAFEKREEAKERAAEKNVLKDDKPTESEKTAAEQIKEVEKVKAAKEEEKKECLSKATTILQEYGIESNIPVGSEYWGLMNRYRSLAQE